MEPNAALRRLLDVTLRGLGPTTIVSGATAARAALRSQTFDVAVTDLSLGNLDYSWVDELVDTGVPVVVVTAHGLTEELSAINPGAHIVVKPFRARALRCVVQRASVGCGQDLRRPASPNG